MRIRIIVCYSPRYMRGHLLDRAARHRNPLSALTLPDHQVEVVHQQVRAVPSDRDVDLVALSFFSGFARERMPSPITIVRWAWPSSLEGPMRRTGSRRLCSMWMPSLSARLKTCGHGSCMTSNPEIAAIQSIAVLPRQWRVYRHHGMTCSSADSWCRGCCKPPRLSVHVQFLQRSKFQSRIPSAPHR